MTQPKAQAHQKNEPQQSYSNFGSNSAGYINKTQSMSEGIPTNMKMKRGRQ